MNDDNFDEYENQNVNDKEVSYSFPGFGTGNEKHQNNDVTPDENFANNNQINNNNQIVNNNAPSNLENTIPSSGSNITDGMKPKENDARPINNAPQNNSGLSSEPKNNNGNEGPDLKKNNNQNPNNNQENPFFNSKNKKDGDKDNNKDNQNKDKKTDNNQNKDGESDNNDNKSSFADRFNPKNLGKKALGAGANAAKKGLNNLKNDIQGDDAVDDSPVVSSLKNAGRNITGVVMFIIANPWLAIIIGIIIVALFLLILIATNTSAIFSGKKYGGWYCNMYSPTTSENAGQLTSFYGWRIYNGAPDPHTGVDITYESKGAEVLATHDGTITTFYGEDEAYGTYINIDYSEDFDDKKYRTYYAHLCNLEEEQELKKSCEAGEYTGCDDRCKETTNADGEKEYEYEWACGASETAFKKLINKLENNATVKAGDVIGYVSDTGYRSAACDFHLHYESQANKNYDNPDAGYVPEDINRYFNIEDISLGCDPVLNNGDDPPSTEKIIKWKCQVPDDTPDTLFEYCDVEKPITPEDKRFGGIIDPNITDGSNFVAGIGTYSANVCGYKPNPEYAGTDAQCAAGVHDYFESFLPQADPEAWSKFQNSVKATGAAKEYWYNNAKLGTSGFKTSSEPVAGSIYVRTTGTYGHVMVIEKVEGDNVTAYECNHDGGLQSGKVTQATNCQSRVYKKSELKDAAGYIQIIDEEKC